MTQGTCNESASGKTGMLKTFHDFHSQFPNLTEDNFDKEPEHTRSCPEGFTRNRVLDPQERCNDEFSFTLDTLGGGEVMHLDSHQLESSEENYCIDFHQG